MRQQRTRRYLRQRRAEHDGVPRLQRAVCPVEVARRRVLIRQQPQSATGPCRFCLKAHFFKRWPTSHACISGQRVLVPAPAGTQGCVITNA